MFSLVVRNLIFTVIHPGLVVGLIPYWIAGDEIRRALSQPFQLNQYIGMLIFIMGIMLLIYCIYLFGRIGRGTLSPADPTRKLVDKGLYQFSRNPMYIGVLLGLTGEAIFTLSMSLFIYALVIFIMFNLFIMFVEEPRLKKDFGQEYQAYTQRVRRWL